MKQWHFFEKIYRRWVVVFEGSEEELVEELKLSGYKEDMTWFKGANGACLELNSENNDNGNDATVVWLRKFDLPTLVHEVSHLTMMLFEQVGVPISRENTEAFSFYNEFWFTEIQKTRRKFPDGNKPKDARK